MTDAKISFKSKDGQIFEMEEKASRLFKIIETILDDCMEMGSGGADEVIKLEVRGEILEKIIRWADHHKDDDPEEEQQELSEWDKEFLKLDKWILFELVLAANYLDIKKLLDIAIAVIAGMLKDKDTKSMREIFNLN